MILHPGQSGDHAVLVYRWNPDLRRWEWWQPYGALWVRSTTYGGQDHERGPADDWNNVIDFDTTWAEPLHV